jgi:hypothetical protein
MSEDNNLMNHLLRSGITPSFAFPLDVLEFRGERQIKWKKSVWPKMSTDLKMGLSTYSPGKVLTVDGDDYQVEGLYIYGAEDSINRAEEHFLTPVDKNDRLKYYNRCTNPGCGWVSKEIDEALQISQCPVCKAKDDENNDIKIIKTDIWYRPDGFAPRIMPWDDKDDTPMRDIDWNRTMKAKPVTKGDDDIDPAGGVEFPAPLTDELESNIRDYGIEDLDNSLSSTDKEMLREIFQRVNLRSTKDDGVGVELILINSGYNGQGYYVCQSCGAIERQADKFQSDTKGHYRPYIATPNEKTTDPQHPSRLRCKGLPFSQDPYRTIYLGMTFITDMLMISIPGKIPFDQDSSTITNNNLDTALITLKEALITEIQKEAKLVNREIKGGIRKRRNTTEDIPYFEIYLYDDVSGGAGLTSSILNQKNSWSRLIKILKSTEERLSGEKCLDKNGCDRACLGCLLDFRNKREHDYFDRKQGLRLIRYIIYGDTPSFESGCSDGEIKDLQILVNRINQHLLLFEKELKLEVVEGSLVARNEGKELHIRPIIDYVDYPEDQVVKEWLGNNTVTHRRLKQFDKSLKLNTDKTYTWINLDVIEKTPSTFSEDVYRIFHSTF